MILGASLQKILSSEVTAASPFRIFTLVIFALAIIHTLLANQFTHLSKKVAAHHKKKTGKGVSILAEILYFFGEIEVIFALWVIPLVIGGVLFFSWNEMIQYLDSRIYIEPFFIVVMMSLASTRPILELAENGMHKLGKFFGDTAKVWWLTAMTIGPVLGSVITEAAAMTIVALLLREKVFSFKPTKRLAYGTLGLMFVNFSVGGILTNFAAPPSLILSRCWNWTLFNFINLFEVRVLLGIVIINLLYFFFLKKDLYLLEKEKTKEKVKKKEPIPIWISLIHLGFLGWTVFTAHYLPVFLGSFLLFLGFHRATRVHQSSLNLKPALLVGLFLAGLTIHGGFQGWWIEGLIGDLQYGSMMLAGTALTAFNENSTVAYLACLVHKLTPLQKYALASGIVAGGGLTIIAHAPNPVGASLLRPHFRGGISPWNLFLGAIIPTGIFLAIFFFFPPY